MIKVEKNGVRKVVDKELAAQYVKAGWKIVEEKKEKEYKPIIKND